jgi:hypothetical protein
LLFKIVAVGSVGVLLPKYHEPELSSLGAMVELRMAATFREKEGLDFLVRESMGVNDGILLHRTSISGVFESQYLLDDLWDIVKSKVEVRGGLLETGDSVLVENTENVFFGKGSEGCGLNVWGQLLMMVRAYARRHGDQGLGLLPAPEITGFLPAGGFFDPKEALRSAELDLALAESIVLWEDAAPERNNPDFEGQLKLYNEDVARKGKAVADAVQAFESAAAGWDGPNFLKQVQAHFKGLELPEGRDISG